ncbi:efflux RND transporter periplasmic adaptor subunit [bacterium]|nr:efflux RND transporter periplasmic adaptor subunit [bacterium]
MKKGKYIISVSVVVVILILFKVTVKNRQEAGATLETTTQEEIIQVMAEKATNITMAENIIAVGNIEPFKTVVIYPEATGVLEKLTVKEGDYVKKGTLIAVIENQQRQLNVEQVEIEIKAQKYQLENIKQDYDRFQRLTKEGAIAAKRFEDVETLYKASEERLKGLEKQLEIAKRRFRDTSIYAPISGIVAQKFIDEGELVTESSMTKSSPLVAIIDTSKVKVTVPIGETDLKKIKKGQNVSVETDMYDKRRFPGKIDEIMPITDFVTRTTKVQILVDNPSYILKPGLFTRVSISTGSRNTLAIPLDALLRLQGSGSYYCFIINNDDTVEKVYLDIGDLWEGMAEVKSGLKEGDTVIVSSQSILETGKKVAVSTL